MTQILQQLTGNTMSGCNKRLLLQVFLGISQGILVLTQGALLNYYIISHFSSSMKSYFFFLGDFICVFAFAGTLTIAYRYLVDYHKEQMTTQTFMYSPKRLISQYPTTKLGMIPLIYVSWTFYALLLIAKLAVIFTSQIPDKLSPRVVAGPQLLRVSIALSGIIFLILVESHNWAERGSPRYSYVTSVCQKTGIEVLDTVSFLSIITSGVNDADPATLTPAFETLIVVLSGVNFLLPVLILYKLSLGERSCGRWPVSVSLLHTLLHVCCIDVPFLGVRLYLWVKFNHNSSVFIMKNVFGILNSLRSIYPDVKELLSSQPNSPHCIEEYLPPDKIQYIDEGNGEGKTTEHIDELKRINPMKGE